MEKQAQACFSIIYFDIHTNYSPKIYKYDNVLSVYSKLKANNLP
jgi:hypothetical protein